jgi:hypothetical protein
MMKLLDLFRKRESVVEERVYRKKGDPGGRSTLIPLSKGGIEAKEMTEAEIAEHFQTIQTMTGSFKLVKKVKSAEEILTETVLDRHAYR